MATLPDLFATPLVLGVAQGVELAAEERAVFTSLYAREAPRVHRFLRDLLGDAALAADATQETFARVFAHGEILRDGERAVPWIFGVARNVSFEMRKARARAGRVFQPECAESEHASSPRKSPEGDLLDREALTVVDAALKKLSEDRRALLLLRLDHGFSYDEIAELMGFSLAKVKVEIFRAREILRETIAEYRGDEDGRDCLVRASSSRGSQ